jgi:hypothetical protein
MNDVRLARVGEASAGVGVGMTGAFRGGG